MLKKLIIVEGLMRTINRCWRCVKLIVLYVF